MLTMVRASKTCVLALVGVSVLGVAPACDGDTEVPPPVELRGAGAGVSVALAPFEIRILDPSGKEVLRTLTGGGQDAYGAPAATYDEGPDGIKVIPGWDGYYPEERPWAHGARARVLGRTDASASFELDAGAGKLRIDVAIDGAKVSLKTTASSAEGAAASGAWNKTSLSFALGEDDHFFGLGERFASVDHRGLSMYAWAEEGGAGKGERVPADDQNPFPNGPSMTYFPVPFFLSSAGYAVHLATTFRTETHFGSERKDAWRVAANTSSFETVVYVHDDPLASLDDFTRETGRPMVPASWVFGPRRRVSSGDRVGDLLEWKKLREARVPTTGLDDAVHLLPARSELGREAELLAWTRDAHAWGFKVMAYNNPYISTSKPQAEADLAYGKERGLFAMTAEGTIGETFFISGDAQTLATNRPHEAGGGRVVPGSSSGARWRSATTAGCTTSASTCGARGPSPTAARATSSTTPSPSSARRPPTISSPRSARTIFSSSFARATPARSSGCLRYGAAIRRRPSTRPRGSRRCSAAA